MSRASLVTPERAQALRAALSRKGLIPATRADATPLVPATGDAYETDLSYAQERLWIVDQVEGGSSAAYNIGAVVSLQGPLDPIALRRSLGALVERHATLRTRIHARAGTPRQQIDRAPARWPLPIVDLSAARVDEDRSVDAAPGVLAPTDAAGADAAANDLVANPVLVGLARAERRRPFDLARDWPLRTTLVRIEPARHVLLLTVHHIAADGWSLGVLVREMAALYGAGGDIHGTGLTPLPIQYADYAREQRAWLGADRLEVLQQYWRDRLRGAPAQLTLPTDGRRGTGLARRGDSVSIAIPAAVVRGLQALARREETTLFSTVLAGFGALLGRLAGQDEVCIGTPVANRRRAEWEGLIGFFVNTLVLRCAPAGAASFAASTFRALIAQMRDTVRDAYAHQDLPFERLVEHLQPPRIPGVQPLFQAMLAWQNTPEGHLEAPGLILRPLPIAGDTAAFDLTLSLRESDEGLRGVIEYNADLFSRARVETWAGLLRELLTRAADSPDRPLAELPMLSPADQLAILRRNAGDRVIAQLRRRDDSHAGAFEPESLSSSSIGEQFSRVAAAHPDVPAVLAGTQRVTYAELERRSNQLARYLRQQGVQPEAIVGLLLDRGPALIEALLAVWKAGAAYVYVDVTMPAARREAILADAGVRHVITDLSTLLRASTVPLDARVIILDHEEDRTAIDTCAVDAGDLPVSPRQLAYLIYTSGSTGAPKGVAVEHGGVLNLARWQRTAFGITAGSRISQHFSYNFDGAVGETMMALLNGGTLVPLDLEGVGPARIIDALNAHAIDVAVFVPAILQLLDPDALEPSPHRTIVSVGDVCPPALAARWAARCRFVNAYGPTEYTVYSHLWTHPPDAAPEARVPIGRSIHNTETYVLDEALNPVPEGVLGDFYLSGEGLARGYLHRGDLTAASFLPNPFWPLTRTIDHGDVALPSAQQAIETFRAAHAGLRPSRRPRPPASAIAQILSRLNALDDDLASRTRMALETWGDDVQLIGALCRYMEEGLQRAYESCAITEDLLRLLLPLPVWRGAAGVDLGCGNGEVLSTLQRMGARPFGLDLNPLFVQAARRRGLQAQVARVDGSDEDFAAFTGLDFGSQDFVLSTLVLDRVARPRQLLRNMLRLLKPGGRFALQTLLPLIPVDDGPLEAARLVYTSPEHRITRGNDADDDRLALTRLLFELGADDIETCRVPYLVASLDGLQEYVVWSVRGTRRDDADTTRGAWLRMYRTGDRGRLLPDGSLDFLGRADRQVKLHGYRIEPGEIESALMTHPAVREAIVRVDEAASPARLVAYVMARAGETIDAGELRAHLQERLPIPMMPATFVALDAFPLTPTGKIDVVALAGLATPLAEFPVHVDHGGRNAIETQLAAIWSDVLGVASIGPHQDFFALGGHSLLAFQVMARIERDFSVRMGIRHLFESPTIAGLALRIRSALDATPSSPSSLDSTPIVPIDRTRDLPLTYAQRRMWFLDHLEGEHGVLLMGETVRWTGPLDRGALARALTELVRRHEILRTSYPEIDGVPRQRVAPAAPVPLPSIDLAGLDPAARERTAEQIVARESRRPFNLRLGPVVRVLLVRLAPDIHVFSGRMHHIAADGWSIRALVRELDDLYRAYAEGRSPRPAMVGAQYGDYAVWEQALVERGTLEPQRAYWRDRLRDAPPPLELCADRVRQGGSRRGGEAGFEIPPSRVQQIRAFCREIGGTPFMLLLAAFNALAARLSGTTDIAVGIPTANRARTEVEATVGVFINTLILRTDVSGNPTFRDLVARVREASLGALAHQEVPLELVLEDLRAERDLGRTPLINVMFNGLDIRAPRLSASSVAVAHFPTPAPVPNVDLTIYVGAVVPDQPLAINWVYDATRFEAATIRQLQRQYVLLLESALDDPGRQLSALTLTSDQEWRALRASRSATAPDLPLREWSEDWVHGSITMLFEHRVREQPDRVAVDDGTTSWTYAELREAVAAVAGELRDRGVTRGSRVAMLCGQHARTIPGVLAVLDVGAAYVPLDPHSPPARLREQWQHADPAMLLSDDEWSDLGRDIAHGRERAQTEALIVSLQASLAHAPAASAGSRVRGTCPVSADALAYLLHTSGSTGRPKAVMQSHGGVLRHIRAYSHALRIQPDDRLTMIPSYGFDAAVMDMFGALLNGAMLQPIDLRAMGLAGLVKHLRRGASTIYHSTPTVFRLAMSLLAPGERIPAVRLVVFGGEVCTREDAEAFREHFEASCLLVNGLGPTECSQALQHVTDGNQRVTRPTVPIGRPLPGTDVRLMGPHGEITSVFEPGEIVLRSEQVALGYWRDEALTRAAFSTAEGEHTAAGGLGGLRTYRTGDLARLLPDGTFEFVGRRDAQIKIRGIRIEPGEIEANLTQHADIDQAAVVLREDAGISQLVAYVVMREGAIPAPTAWRSHLASRLPEAMIPSAFVPIPLLPLLANGKLNRRALPAPPQRAFNAAAQPGDGERSDAPTVQQVASQVARPGEPRGPIEAALAMIWASLLQVDRFDRDANLFELGAHSLLATQLAAAVERVCGVEFALRWFFEEPTVAGQAARIELAQRECPRESVLRRDVGPAYRSLVPLQTSGACAPFFCAHPLSGSASGFYPLAKAMGEARPFYGLQARGLDGLDEPLETIEAMAAHYIDAMRTVRPHGPYLLAGWSFGGVVAIEMAAQLQRAGARVAQICLFDTQAPSSYDAGKLARLDDASLLSEMLTYRVEIPRGFGLDQFRGHFQVFRANRRAMARYLAIGFEGPCVLLRAHDGLDDRPDHLGWRDLMPRLRVELVPGDHFSMLSDPHVTVLAERLNALLPGE
jgi:amino acid adenylation domain-containing protein